jgi:hypothetical protein
MKLIVRPDQVRGPDGILESDRQAGTHVFEGMPDSRQSPDVALPTSRFRPRYRALTDAEKALHDDIKGQAAELEALFEQVPAGRYKALAFTDLESSVMWIVKQITS